MGVANSSNSSNVQDNSSKPSAGQTTETPFNGKVIKCGIIVRHSDVSKFISENDESLSDEDRRVLQGCFDLFESKPEFVWRHCAIEVMCPSLNVKFMAGNETNRYIVRIKNGEVVTPNMSKSHRARAHDGFLWIWTHARDSFSRVRNLAIEYVSKNTNEEET
ncbi:uncharacterized protein [Haliotis cracherodii]|uniref:uncharacterized protein n=1 Tax=Haliotis cracherodii TaxID=6455 RepID=UPI0039E954DD